jgi:general secretion pathway protein M
VSKLTREQTMAAAALAGFIVVCAGLAAWSLNDRAEAAQELSDRQDVLARLETGAHAKADAHGPIQIAKAPPAAFVNASTPGLASAMLEAQVAQLAGHHATLVSFSVQSGAAADGGNAVRIEASMDISQRALQALLYELESGTPYVFIDSMTARPAAGSAQSGAADPLLRATLGLRALWRHKPS